MVVPPILPLNPDADSKPCSSGTAAERFHKALHLQAVAGMIEDDAELVDAYALVCIRAGVAAADSICCHVLGRYVPVGDTPTSVTQLEKVGDQSATEALRNLFKLRRRIVAGHMGVSMGECHAAGSQMNSLIEYARSRGVPGS